MRFGTRSYDVHRAACLTLMKLHARDSPLTLRDAEWQALCDRLHGYSGSDIATVILGALFEPIRDLQKATHWAYTSGQFFMRQMYKTLRNSTL